MCYSVGWSMVRGSNSPTHEIYAPGSVDNLFVDDTSYSGVQLMLADVWFNLHNSYDDFRPACNNNVAKRQWASFPLPHIFSRSRGIRISLEDDKSSFTIATEGGSQLEHPPEEDLCQSQVSFLLVVLDDVPWPRVRMMHAISIIETLVSSWQQSRNWKGSKTKTTATGPFKNPNSNRVQARN